MNVVAKLFRESGDWLERKSFSLRILKLIDWKNINMIMFLLKWGMDPENTLIFASKHNCPEVLLICKQFGVCLSSYSYAMCIGAELGHEEIVKVCYNIDHCGVGEALYYAAMCGNIKIVKLCLDWGGIINWAICGATFGCKLPILQYCHERGVRNFSWSILTAETDKNFEFAKKIKKLHQN